ncbi:MAG TPA: fibronectin type III domain-containing protein, partial [Bacteroidales bacterium]|nr:fibronectin type III domain-containing protein [Bacteroidales bacterium]
MTKKLFLFCLALATALSLQAQTYRYLKVLTLKSSNHKWQELEWFSEGTAYPQPKMTSANSNGMRAYGDSGAGEAWQPYDGDPATHAWIGEINPPQTHSLILDLGESNGIRPDSLRITKPSYSLVYDFQVWASNDENLWALLLDARDLASDGHSQMTFPLAEIPDTARPSSPQNLVLHRATLTSLNIGWDVSTDDRELDHYVVYLDDTAVDSTSENNRLITGLDTATVYSCFVVAVDNAGNRSEKSEVMDFSTKEVDLLPPSDPAGLTLEESRYDLLQMSWSPSTDNDELSGYIVYMNNQIVGATSDTVFAVPGLIPQSSFDFKVYAKDLSGNLSEGYASGSFATTGDVPGKMLIGTNFWNISWGGSGNDPFINGYQNVTGDNPWKPVFLDDVSFYSHYRFMDWLEIN